MYHEFTEVVLMRNAGTKMKDLHWMPALIGGSMAIALKQLVKEKNYITMNRCSSM